MECLPADPHGDCPVPDLVVDESRLGFHYVDGLSFEADSCVMQEGCTAEPGTRALLRFTTRRSSDVGGAQRREILEVAGGLAHRPVDGIGYSDLGA